MHNPGFKAKNRPVNACQEVRHSTQIIILGLLVTALIDLYKNLLVGPKCLLQNQDFQ